MPPSCALQGCPGIVVHMFTSPPPQRVARDTYLVRHLVQGPGAPVAVHCNSLVIAGSEPVLVDTGGRSMREQWLEQAFSLVDPDDVRWVFLSHDDVDHDGNLEVVLERCPQATLVTSWFASERMAAGMLLDPRRQRWVGDGESFAAGDRVLTAVRPPVFDSPTSRGLLDSASGVYWSCDAFGTPVPELVDDVSDLDPQAWVEGSYLFNSLLSPWHTMVDLEKFQLQVDRIRDLEPRVIVGAHGPVLRGDQVDRAVSMLRSLPQRPVAAQPGQADLEAMLAVAGAAG